MEVCHVDVVSPPGADAPPWAPRREACEILRRTRRRALVRSLLLAGGPPRWVSEWQSTPWPPAYDFHTVVDRAVSDTVVGELHTAAVFAEFGPPTGAYRMIASHKTTMTSDAAVNVSRAVRRAWSEAFGGSAFPEPEVDALQDGFFLRYQPGEPGVPPLHLDVAAVAGRGAQVANAILYQTDVESGGETLLDGGRLAIAPARGRLVVWRSYTEDGDCLEPRALHTAAPVLVGLKLALAVRLRRPV